jgi:hypothetical protein
MAAYPAGLDGYDPTITYGAKHKNLLAELESQVFSDDISIRKFDISQDSAGQTALLKASRQEGN